MQLSVIARSPDFLIFYKVIGTTKQSREKRFTLFHGIASPSIHKLGVAMTIYFYS